MIRKLYAAAILGLVSILAPTIANAYTTVYSGLLTIPNGGFAEHAADANNGGGFAYGGIARAQYKFMSSLKSTISAPIVSMLSTVEGYQPGTGYALVSGPITFALDNGTASISGLQLHAGLTVKQSKYGITANCSIDVSNNPGTTISGTIDPLTGTFNFTGVQNFSLSSSYSCSSNLDWVPIVNIVINTLLDQAVGNVLAQQTQIAYNSLSYIGELQPIHFAGLDTIPDGVLIYNGVDYGSLIRSKLVNLFGKSNIRVTIGDPKYFVTGPKGYAHLAHSSDLILSFAIDEINFQLLEKRTYVDEMFCPGNGRYCYPF